MVEARDLDRHVPVVLRVLDLELVTSPDALSSFEREAARAAGFRHPNIATAQSLQRRANLVFYALDVGYAKSLESLLTGRVPPGFERSLDILQGIAAALDYEHSQGSIHGRLTPGMIFVDDDHVLVSGFGGMQGVESYSGNSATLYQAPEQSAWRQEIDGRVDVYALGVIAYELISGKRLPRLASGAASSAEPLRISRNAALAPGISLQVNEAILHAIAKRPSQRFATAGEFITALGASHAEPRRNVAEETSDETVVHTAAEIWTRLLDGAPREMEEAPRETDEESRETDEEFRETDPAFRVRDAAPWATRPRLPKIPARFGTAFGIGCLCVVGALAIFSLSKRISVHRFPSAVMDALSHLPSPLKAFEQWRGEPHPHQAATPGDSGTASRVPRVTKSGVVVENGVLVFPGEKGSDSSGASRASARRRATDRATAKQMAH
jgi:serine/threonine protein kinase